MARFLTPFSPRRARTTLPLTLVVCLAGCSSFMGGGLFKRDDPDDEAKIKKLLKVPDPPKLIREAAMPNGLKWTRVEGVGVINALPGTGGPAQPSTLRDMLIEEMKRNDIPNANEFLERDDNVLVQVHANVPPGARRGDVLDLWISTPDKTDATDLHGGWLLDTRLRHQQVLRNTIRSSEVMTVATGPILTRADYEGDRDESTKVEGRVLSGGVVQIDRPMGLILRPEFQHVKMSAEIAKAVNRRFFFFDGTTRRGIAKPIEDDYIEVEVHPRYRGNENRLMEVIRGLGVAAESSDTQTRLVELGRQLRDPASAADAALQLEGLGEGAIPTLTEAINQSNPELRFYAAEALAYLDRREAIDPLIASIKADPAFRAPALDALRGLQHHAVVDALRGLFDDPSLETRYGAFVALRRRGDASSVLGGENLGGAFRLYTIASTAPPAVIVSLQKSPEVVLMGTPSKLALQSFFRGPTGLLFKQAETPGRVRVSRFRPGQEDARTEVAANLADLLRGVVAVGGGYGDAVAMLRLAKTQGVLVDQLAMDPLPKYQRTYYRSDDDDAEDDSQTAEPPAKKSSSTGSGTGS